MKIQVAQIWSASFFPWQSDEPWNTALPDGSLVLSQPVSTVKYGIKFLADADTLTISQQDPSLKYGIKFIAETLILTIESVLPKKIGALWERILKVSTEKWEEVGTILWSWRNYPWLADYFPWQEKGGRAGSSYTQIEKPSTVYETVAKPTTVYTTTAKPSTIYTEITKPHN
jgi:hypothetical protein